ncbi:hypothetical protein [Daejeonella sp.]|uniref:hypothetical protein n=1 Tax=Daejeonella sp. TaxID=2805397 RepID=UPI002731AAE7|nr:hypothetical protein [Daejeonella sp.]MDP2413245.1 hypothetical protein [Daejeonella sp.]
MKLSLKIALIFIVFTSVSCDKEERLQSKLEGTWELRHIEGGYRPANSPSDYEPGNGNILKFDGNKFQQKYGTNPAINGTYTIIEEEAEVNGEKLSHKIDFQSDQNVIDLYFKISGGKLSLYYGHIAADGFVSTYEKQ